jgi:hypothetical protein
MPLLILIRPAPFLAVRSLPELVIVVVAGEAFRNLAGRCLTSDTDIDFVSIVEGPIFGWLDAMHPFDGDGDLYVTCLAPDGF